MAHNTCFLVLDESLAEPRFGCAFISRLEGLIYGSII